VGVKCATITPDEARVEEFKLITEALDCAGGVSAIEVNLACPNVSGGGLAFSADAQAAFDVVKAVRDATDLTVIAKITPTLVDVRALAQVCAGAGADATDLLSASLYR
jgi:dihydroorotate dehydrogenase (NAD+) catalytic subunit